MRYIAHSLVWFLLILSQGALAQTVILSETVTPPGADSTAEVPVSAGNRHGGGFYYGMGANFGEPEGPVKVQGFGASNLSAGGAYRYYFAKRNAMAFNLGYSSHAYRIQQTAGAQHPFADSMQFKSQRLYVGNLELGAAWHLNLTGNAWAGSKQGLFLELGGRLLVRLSGQLYTRLTDTSNQDDLALSRNLKDYMAGPQFAGFARLGYRFICLEYEHRLTDYFKANRLPLDVQMPVSNLRLVLFLGQ
ncbi:MAG: hypothetical protein KF690_05720 [Bacteroidetes bacterium]|nr:hypothetical protein [Bacteroidota bacterium]